MHHDPLEGLQVLGEQAPSKGERRKIRSMVLHRHSNTTSNASLLCILNNNLDSFRDSIAVMCALAQACIGLIIALGIHLLD